MIVIGADTHKQSHTCGAVDAGTDRSPANSPHGPKARLRELLDEISPACAAAAGRVAADVRARLSSH